ncbi:MAG: substrate-binding domain-containing protein [Bdellovibrionales bacterium]|nr:substrate-binding domain-containing protein [Bdellovibrionales bacterium]
MKILRYLGFILLVACNSNPATQPTEKMVIAVIPKGASHEFWKSVHAGAEKASQELGVDIIWKSPAKESDREEQIKIVEDFTISGVSGIVLSPADDTALRLPVKEAVSSGIPVIIIDSELKSQDQLSFVATDNYQGGVLAARELARQLNNKGKAIMLRYQVGQASTTKREEGFLKTMADEFPEIEIVSSNQHSGVTTETAYQASENLLARFKGPDGKLTIDGIFAPCEPVAFGMLRALEDMKLGGTVKLVGFDASEKLVQGLEQGYIDALIMQDPVGMGYHGVKLMKDHLEGKKIDTRLDTGVFIVTKENMAEPKMQALIKPDLEKWLG